MRLPLTRILILCAWLLATGSQWDLVQTFGWGRMIASYSQTMPLREAIRLTFTADNLCGICKTVAKAKGQNSDDAGAYAGKEPVKLLLAPVPESRLIWVTPTRSVWSVPECRPHSNERPAPPVEPPRFC